MSRTRDWLGARAPGPVMELEPWLEGERERAEGEAPEEAVAGAHARAARRALDRALARPGRVRESAWDLLAADALLTYACEAALEEDAPEERLRRILEEALRR